MPQSQLWVDADACPRVIKEILYRAADRAQVQLTLVANQPLTVPGSRYIRSVQVAGGFDVADSYIVRHAGTGDLVVTADIPLAAEVIEKGCLGFHGHHAQQRPGDRRPATPQPRRSASLRQCPGPPPRPPAMSELPANRLRQV
jgi:hypothetical protein